MDKKQPRRSSVTVPSSHPAPPRHSLHRPRCRSESLKNTVDYTSDPPRPASLVRVQEQIDMNTPPPRNSGVTWVNGLSSRKGTPGRPGSPHTPGTPRRAETPEGGASSLVNPSSALLQDLLKEQRATRSTRGASEDMDIQVPRTPERSQSQAQSQSQSQSQSQDDAVSERQKKVNSALSAGLRQPREMGVREMDQYVSKLNKQNFDLKLDIFHRTQHVTALEKRLEQMQELEEEVSRMRGLEDELEELRNAEEDNQRLRESNEQLRNELDKRDQAVTEAVELICQLEAKVDELECRDLSRPSTSGPDAVTPKQQTIIDIPERTSSRRGTRLGHRHSMSPESRQLQSAPSFLRDENKGTAALRGLYIPSGSQSAMSVITKSESLNSMNEALESASPRLSALSECSDLLPEDVPVVQNGLSQVPETETASSETLELRHVEQEGKRGHIDQWIQPLPEMNRASMFEFKSPIHEGDLNNNDPRQRVFGVSRLPPTPDTMSTAYAPRTNPSNGSLQTDKGQLELMKQRLARPRSFDELTTRQSSGNSGNTDSLDTNLAGASPPELGASEREEALTLVPLDVVATKQRRRATCQQTPPIWPGLDNYGGSSDKGIDKVLSKMENAYYSPSSNTLPSKRHTLNFTSSSPPLTPEDWVEAANSNPRSKREGILMPSNHNPTSIDYALGTRRPGQSAFSGRRHSMDSAIPDPTTEPTLDLCSLEAGPQPASRLAPAPPLEPTSRRRITFRPPFLNRLANPRRNVGTDDDGAPAPIIAKTRNMGSKPLRLNENGERPPSSLTELSAPVPTYAEPRSKENVPRTLPHSFTESNLWSNGTGPRPVTANSTSHKRRSSLGLFGWMKEASGIGSNSKRPEPHSPVTPLQLNSAARRRLSMRMTPEGPGVIPEATQETVIATNPNVGLTGTARQAFKSDEEPGRRPRYMERRPRRV